MFDLWIVVHGALKTRSFSGFDLWIVLEWSPKNKDLFRIGIVDRPCMEGVSHVDRPRVEPLKRGGVPYWTQIFCLVFDIDMEKKTYFN